jgi:hypothetical protein
MKISNQLLPILAIIFGLAFQPIKAQNQTTEKPVFKISGKVFEKGKEDPIPYAAVALIDAETGKNVAGAVADFGGEFVIANFG